MAAALHYLARTLCRPPAGTPEGRQDEEGPEVDIAWNMQEEVDNLLAKSNDGGVEMDEGAVRILEEEIARIAEEAARRARDSTMEARRNNGRISRWRRSLVPAATTTIFCLSLLTIASASGFAGFWCAVKAYEDIVFSKENLVYLGLAFKLKEFLERHGHR